MGKFEIAVLMMGVCAWGQTRSAEAINKRVRSCEKRDWPLSDPVCHGYALSMAHDYYQEHPDFYESKPVDFPEIASIKISGIGSLQCKDNQHIEGDGKSEAGNHCVDDPKLLTSTGGKGVSLVVSGSMAILSTGLQSHEVITRDGHYTYTIDDPNNIYRCQVVSVVDPHNILQDAPAFMIACYKQHEVEKEK